MVSVTKKPQHSGLRLDEILQTHDSCQLLCRLRGTAGQKTVSQKGQSELFAQCHRTQDSPLQPDVSVRYRPALTPSGEADLGHGLCWALICPEIPREKPRSSCKMFLRSAPER